MKEENVISYGHGALVARAGGSGNGQASGSASSISFGEGGRSSRHERLYNTVNVLNATKLCS